MLPNEQYYIIYREVLLKIKSESDQALNLATDKKKYRTQEPMNYSIGMQLTKCKLRETLKISKDQMTVFPTINY